MKKQGGFIKIAGLIAAALAFLFPAHYIAKNQPQNLGGGSGTIMKLNNTGGTSIGGTVTGGTLGSVLFINSTGILAQDNANFFYDSTSHNLRLGPTSTAISSENKLSVIGNTNDYHGTLVQNMNSGTMASTDMVLGNDLSTADATTYADLGINSSGNTNPAQTLFGASDAYLYTSGQVNNLNIGTGVSGKSVKFFTGGTLAANERMRITDTGVGIGTTSPSSRLQVSGTDTQTSGTGTAGLTITPTYNQTSGTAANTDLLVNRTQTAVGSGAQLLADFQVGGASKLKVSNIGTITFVNSNQGISFNGSNDMSIGNANASFSIISSSNRIQFSSNTAVYMGGLTGGSSFGVQAVGSVAVSTPVAFIRGQTSQSGDLLQFSSNPTSGIVSRFDVNGHLFIGGSTSPTALIHLAAGTATASTSPLKFTSGTNLTTAEAGAMEYDGTTLSFTNGGAQRQELPQIQQSRVSTQFDKTTNTTLASITGLTATLVAGKTYKFNANLFLTADAIGGGKFAIGGTATATSIIYHIDEVCDASNLNTITSTQTALAGSAGQAGCAAGLVKITGTITVNAAGTLTTQFAQNASNGTSSILVGSTFETQQVP